MPFGDQPEHELWIGKEQSPSIAKLMATQSYSAAGDEKLREAVTHNSKCLMTYAAYCFPEIVGGQKHFARVLMECVAQDLAEALATAPLPPTKAREESK